MRALLPFVLALLILFTGSTLEAQSSTLRPTLPRCEYRENPMGVDVPQPRLSWILQSSERGATPVAYQILAASSLETLAQDRGDLWDSGKAVSNGSNQAAYAGRSLVSSQRVFWKVRVQDSAGKISAWSAPAMWVMGVVAEADWLGAKWIGAPDNDKPFDAKAAIKGPKEKYESVLLRRGVTVKPGLRRAVVHVCGLAEYEMTLNGNKVGDALLTPGWTDYEKTCLYDSYDVTAALRPGANALGLFLGNGFYNTHGVRYTKVQGTFGPLQAIALLRLEYADGSVENVVTDQTWKTSSGPIVFSSIYGGEDFDARLVQKGWDQPGFNDGSWERPGVTTGPGGALRGLSASAPPIRVMQTLTPIGKKAISPNVTVYDLGQNAAIMALIKVKGAPGDTVKVTPSEIVHDNGEIDDRMTNNESYSTYTLGGEGEEAYQWKFYYRGARYLRVETKGSPEIIAVEGRVIRADAPVVGVFSTSSDLVNKIHGLVRWAQMSNMLSVMTDCPTREKLGWLEEDHLNGPALRYNFDMSGIFGKMVNDMFDAQRANGLVPSLVPNYYHWDEGKFTTPIEWGSACIFVPWQQYEFEGDARLLAERYDGMKRYLDYLARRANDNIVSFGLGDWYDNLSEGEPTLTARGRDGYRLLLLRLSGHGQNRRSAGQEGGRRAVREQSRRGPEVIRQEILQRGDRQLRDRLAGRELPAAGDEHCRACVAAGLSCATSWTISGRRTRRRARSVFAICCAPSRTRASTTSSTAPTPRKPAATGLQVRLGKTSLTGSLERRQRVAKPLHVRPDRRVVLPRPGRHPVRPGRTRLQEDRHQARAGRRSRVGKGQLTVVHRAKSSANGRMDPRASR